MWIQNISSFFAASRRNEKIKKKRTNSDKWWENEIKYLLSYDAHLISVWLNRIFQFIFSFCYQNEWRYKILESVSVLFIDRHPFSYRNETKNRLESFSILHFCLKSDCLTPTIHILCVFYLYNFRWNKKSVVFECNWLISGIWMADKRIDCNCIVVVQFSFSEFDWFCNWIIIFPILSIDRKKSENCSKSIWWRCLFRFFCIRPIYFRKCIVDVAYWVGMPMISLDIQVKRNVHLVAISYTKWNEQRNEIEFSEPSKEEIRRWQQKITEKIAFTEKRHWNLWYSRKHYR